MTTTRFSLRTIVTFILVAISIPFLAQESDETKSDTLKKVEILSIDQISGETENLRSRLSGLREILQPSRKTLEVDSILDSAYVEIITRRDTLYQESMQYTRRELSISRVNWKNFKSKLKGLQKTLSSRSTDITRVNDDLVEERVRWVSTKEYLLESSESEDVFASLDTMIVTLDDLINLAHVRLDSVFTVQKKLTELILIVDEAISEISRVERLKQKEYFVLDSYPIWAMEEDTLSQDSNYVQKSNLQILKDGIKEDKKQLLDFIDGNVVPFVLQILFLLIFYFVLFQMRLRWKKVNSEGQYKLTDEVKTTFSHLVSSTLVVGLLISSNFYDGLIPVFGEIHILFILVGTFILLPRVSTRSLQWVIGIFLFVFIIQVAEVYYSPRIFLGRIMTISKGVFTIMALVLGLRLAKPLSDEQKHIKKAIQRLAPVYVFVSFIAIGLNCIGMVNLSDMMINGVFLSTAIGAVVILAIKIVTSVMVLSFKLRQAAKFEGLNHMIQATYNRFQPALGWIGFFVWIYYTIRGFELYHYLIDWLHGILDIVWEVGDMKLSLGSILSFLFLIIVSLLIARIIASIFQDDWMVKVLPRGIAPAISLILRILIISIGAYLAFSAAGLDLSKMGFIFGALGVGIGFGLQNVVLNFIAGLILAFERPINLGDTIEVDMEKGVVTNIGVRSSNIRTYSGSEAIIPNGDLISKKVVNWTLANRDRRSKILMKTASSADPEEVIELFNSIASAHDKTYSDPAPKTYFYGYNLDGNLDFALLYWTTFSDTLKTDSEIALQIFKALKEKGIQAPLPTRRIVNE